MTSCSPSSKRRSGPLADGCLVHIVTPTASGYRVIEVWESEQHWRRFRTEILTSLLQRSTGEESPDQPPPQQFPVHAVRIAQAK
jgi:hypothetical protein